MKTVLFSTLKLNGEDESGSCRVERTIRYLEYYRYLKADLGFDCFVMADNASPVSTIMGLGGLPFALLKRDTHFRPIGDLYVHRFDRELFKEPDGKQPYCWRGTYFIKNLMNLGFQKIISIDTDFFILTPRLTQFIRDLDSGYTTLWCPKYEFPESAISVLCEDAFPLMREWFQVPWQIRCRETETFEKAVPYTRIDKSFVGDRYGEAKVPQNGDMDFYAQAPLSVPLNYHKWV